jgi:Flp pilus assembly protein TadG
VKRRRDDQPATLSPSEKRGTEGAVMVEFMAVFFPLFGFFLGIMQLVFIHTANFITQHSANVAVRAAAVVFSDEKPKKPRDEVQRAARIPLSTLGLRKSVVKVDIKPANPTIDQMITVTVTVDFPCRVPLGSWLACGGPKKQLVQGASMPNQGAAYKY